MRNLKVKRTMKPGVIQVLKMVPVEEARKELGRLIHEVQESGQPLVLTRRGAGEAILLSFREYERLKQIEEAHAQLAFRQALEQLSRSVEQAALSPEVVEEAIRAARLTS